MRSGKRGVENKSFGMQLVLLFEELQLITQR